MNSFNIIVLIVFALFSTRFVGSNTIPSATPTSTVAPHPAYQPQESTKGYIPHATYPYADGYGPVAPYETYLYPTQNQPVQESNYISSLIPTAQSALHTALKLFTKVGLFLIGGVALLLVGGVFTTAVCSLTPICTITFAGFNGFDKDAMRSLMTPDRISTAAALVQDAIGKYQRLQRAVNNK